jgi:hypothetical protein
MVLGLSASIAGDLTAIIGLRGGGEAIDAMAGSLAASDDRRIFLALLAAAVRDRDMDRESRIAAMLPDRHPARLWPQGAEEPVDRPALVDLGAASAVKEVYIWMPKPERT